MKVLINTAQILFVALAIVLLARPSTAAAQVEQPADAVQAAAVQSPTIVGGQPAEQGEWGWQVLVRPGAYLCGGSLIAEDWVLTAAHCVFESHGTLFSPAAINVTVGETNRGALEGTEQIRQVNAIFAHEGYNAYTHEHDLALLHLVTPVTLSEAVEIVPLLGSEQLELATAGALATVTGWGTTAEGGYSSGTLMEVEVPVVENELCNQSYGIISDNMICGGYAEGGKDSCQGDSGGPLVVPDGEGNWYLAGIVSFGYGCARADFYGVYTRVSQYGAWVQSTIDSYVVTANETDVPTTGDNKPTEDEGKTESTGTILQAIYLPVVMR
jgi:secreted trypsin-like serine protease